MINPLKSTGSKRPKLSVVTTALNAARDLPLTIESVAAQDFADMEYIVVDGGSWDSSHEVYQRYDSELDRLLEIEDSGVYAAMNFAASQCRGEYVLFMNAGDSFYSASALSNVFAALGGESPDIVHGDHVYVDKGVELHKRSTDFGVTRRDLLRGEVSYQWHDRFPCHQATLTKVELFTRLGGYDTRLEICADHDFLLRAYDASASFRYVDETIAHYFGGGMSAQRGERCGLEWIHIYRRRSLHPQKVDNFFNARLLVHHDSQSSTSGSKLGGFHSPELGDDGFYNWCHGGGFSIMSPRGSDSAGLVMSGENKLEGQTLTFFSKDIILGERKLPIGPFTIALPFPQMLKPSTAVEVYPSKGATLPNDARFTSVLISEFYFQPVSSLEIESISLRETLAFAFANSGFVEPLLHSGWSALEERHVWSVNGPSNLLLAAASDIREIQLTINGNPHLPEAERQVTLSLNGQQVAVISKLSNAPQLYRLRLGKGQWKSGSVNLLTFIPKKTGRAPNDERELGICLHNLTLK